MKCPHCGLDIIKPSYKFCPSCKKPVNNVRAESHESQSKSFGDSADNVWQGSGTAEEENAKLFRNPFRRSKNEAPNENDIKVVKNKVVWSLFAGEIARRVNIDEFDNFTNVKGVYIQEGVKALLIVDGDKVLEFSSGLYYLAGRLDRSVSLVRRIFDFFRGRREGESEHERDMRRNRLDIALQALKGNSVVEVILVSDGNIPVVLDYTEGKDDKRNIIQSRISDLEMGVSLNLQITDYRQFISNYLSRSRSFLITDLQALIKDVVKNELKRLFAKTDIQSTVIPADMESLAKNSIKERLNMVLFGIEVLQVVDVTMDNKDFLRFRELENKLYCSQNELDYLVRTNTFRNRLQDEKNAQMVRGAKSEEELRYALQQVNKDSLLHDDEFEAFVDLHESQRRLRKATTEEEEHEAMLRISKNRLVADDDYKVLENEMKHRQLKRDEVDDILDTLKNRRVELERKETSKLLNIKDIKSSQEEEGAQYEADTQKQQHGFEKETRDWRHDEKQQEHDIYKKDVEGEYQRRVDDRDIERKGKYDDYDFAQRQRKHGQDVVEERDKIDTDDYRNKKDFEDLKRLQELALNSHERMSEMEMSEKDAEAKRVMDLNAQEILKKEKEYRHIESLKALDATLMEAQGKMSAEQIMATQLKDLDPEARKAFADALSSVRDMKIYEMATKDRIAMYEKMAVMSEQYAQGTVKSHQDMMKEMKEMMLDAMHTNADVAKTAVDGHNSNINAQFDAMGKMYANRINEVTSDKEEYREESHSNRDYARHTADTAIGYTTEANRGRSAAEAMSKMASSGKVRMFVINGLGEFTLDGILEMIALGNIQPYTRITVDGETRVAQQIGELRDALLKKYGRKCPKCGKGEILEGEGCPLCGE